MAIYHFSVKTISRAKGRSVVACAAYRSGEKLICDFYGTEQDYTKKTGVEHAQIYAPENTNSNLLNRQNLWNEVEKVERRKDALLAREFEIAFPEELNKEQRKKMLDALCKNMVQKYGVIVDAAIHAPHTGSGSDERNFHAHIMFTTRSINERGQLSAKKYRDFSRDSGTETVSKWREHFADLSNSHLAAAGYDVRVDHRSYEDQESNLEATTHEGAAITKLRRIGIKTEISCENDVIRQRNNDKQSKSSTEHEIYASDAILSDLQQSKAKADAELERQQEIAAERKRERLHAQSILDAQKRALEFHAAFNPDAADKKMIMQYLDDHALLAKSGQEPQPPAPVEQPQQTWWQRMTGQQQPQVEQPSFFEISEIKAVAKQIAQQEQKRAKEEKEQRLEEFMKKFSSEVDQLEKQMYKRAYSQNSEQDDLELKNFIDLHRQKQLEKEITKQKNKDDYERYMRDEATKAKIEAEAIQKIERQYAAQRSAYREKSEMLERENAEIQRKWHSVNTTDISKQPSKNKFEP